MSAAKVTLTDADYLLLNAAHSGVSPRKEPGDWEYSFPHDALVAAVESIAAAKIAEALREAAGERPNFAASPREVHAYLLALADSYDSGVS